MFTPTVQSLFFYNDSFGHFRVMIVNDKNAMFSVVVIQLSVSFVSKHFMKPHVDVAILTDAMCAAFFVQY